MAHYIITQDELKSDGIQCNKEGIYSVYKYTKPVENRDLYKYRSVICIEDKVVCFAPPKSIPYTDFCNLHSSKDIVVEEYVEGTMVNVFWDGTQWKTASRSKIDADCAFFDTNGQFCNMIKETLQDCLLDLNTLNKSYCYSFVMQHINNRIVTEFEINRLYLIAVYRIDGLTVSVVSDFKSDPVWNPTTVQFPTKIDWNGDLNSNTQCLAHTMGVIFKHITSGDRCKLRNPVYEYIRQLRGNQPKLQYRYLELRRSNKTKEFLKYFPEHTNQFNQFNQKIYTYTHTLYNLYVSIYIKKTTGIEVGRQYKKSLFMLHQLYKTTLSPQHLSINASRVIEYVNSLPEPILMTLINQV
jgi:hypothetical protein